MYSDQIISNSNSKKMFHQKLAYFSIKIWILDFNAINIAIWHIFNSTALDFLFSYFFSCGLVWQKPNKLFACWCVLCMVRQTCFFPFFVFSHFSTQSNDMLQPQQHQTCVHRSPNISGEVESRCRFGENVCDSEAKRLLFRWLSEQKETFVTNT